MADRSGGVGLVPSNLAEQALDAIRGSGARGEVHVTGVRGLAAEYAAGKLRNCSSSGRLHLSLRVVRDGRAGFYTTTDTTDLNAAVQRALLAATAGEQVDLEFPGPSVAVKPPDELCTYDPAVADLAPPALADRVRALCELTREVTPGAEVEVDGACEVEETLLLNTSGAAQRRLGSRFSLGAQVARCSAEDVLVFWGGRGSVRLADPVFDELAPRFGELYQGAGERVSLPPGKPRVVLAPEVAYVPLVPLLYGIDGMNANRGVSPLLGKVGSRVLAESLTLVDDPWLDWSPAATRYDGEGTPAMRKHIFNRGVFGGFMHDLRSAALGGGNSTGNGVRGRGQPPRIGPHAMVVEPGAMTLAALLAEAEGGLYVVSVIGGVAGALAGAFSHPVGVGYLVKDGRLAGRVKDVAISGNSYEVMRDGIVGLENRTWSSHGSALHMPHMLLEGVSVSGK